MNGRWSFTRSSTSSKRVGFEQVQRIDFLLLATFVVAVTATSGVLLVSNGAAAAVRVGSANSLSSETIKPHFTTTYPLYTPGALYGASNPAEVCYTCEAANITGSAPPSESLDGGAGVNNVTGDFSASNPLFDIPSAASDFGLTLSYDAQLAQAEVAAGSGATGQFGVGWSSNYDAAVTPQYSDTTVTGTVTVYQGNGAQTAFTESSGTSCPAGDYPTTNKYSVTGSTNQWCALASVQAQLYDDPDTDIVYDTNGGENSQGFFWNGSLDADATNVGVGTVLLYYNIPEGGVVESGETIPCPTSAYDCTVLVVPSGYIEEAYNSGGQIYQVVDPSGVTYNLTFDSHGNLDAIERYANQSSPSTWNYVYSTGASSPYSSDLEEIYDPDSGVSTPASLSAGAAHSTTVTYNTSGTYAGMVSSLEDGTGATTSYSYADACSTGQCLATAATQQATITYPTQVPCPSCTAVSPVEVDNYVSGVESSTKLGAASGSYDSETWSYNWSLGYGAANSTETITYPDTLSGSSPTATITLDPAGNVVQTVNAEGDYATSDYNDSGANDMPELLWSYPGSATTPGTAPSGSYVYTYNANGQIVTATDPLGNVTHYGYYTLDPQLCFVEPPIDTGTYQPTSCPWEGDGYDGGAVTAPVGATAYTYDGQGDIDATYKDYNDTSANADPQYSAAFFNDMGDETSSDPPAGWTGSGWSSSYATATTYTPANLPLTVTKPGEGAITNTYDAALNLVNVNAPSGYTTTVFDADNRPCYQLIGTNGSGLTCTSSLQAGATATTYVPGTSSPYQVTDGNGYATTYYYGDLAYPSQPTEVVDPLDNEVKFTAYNDYGNVCVSGSVSLASQENTSNQCSTVSGDTTTVYNAIGNETSVTDPIGNTTTYAYTNSSYPTSETSTMNALSETTSYQYDADGNLIKTTNPDGTVINTTYDAGGRICTQSDNGTSYACGTGAGVNGVTTYTYNLASDRTSMTVNAYEPDVSKLNVGNEDTCAIRQNPSGTAECWGLGNYGVLGNGSDTNTWSPLAVSGLTGVAQISAGVNNTCALLSGGTVDCWGNNASGELGNGTTTNSWTPVAVSGLSGVTQIAVGGSFTCALLSAGTVKCWGYGYYGQLGNGTSGGGASSTTPVTVTGLSGATAISTGDGGWHACALLSSGAVDCWGENNDGQLGNGTYTNAKTPVAVSGLSGATEIAAGDLQTCALVSSGTEECWGNNSYGQLGNGTTTNSPTPVAVSGLSGASSIAGGAEFDCALLTSGDVDCWGAGGELGDGSSSSSSTPVAVSGLSGVTQIVTGELHACALLTSAAVDCWGTNTYGELGNPPSTTESLTPIALMQATTYSYVDGQLASTTDANGQTISYLYNYAEQVECVAYPVNVSSGCGTMSSPGTPSMTNTIVTNSYDTSGRIASTTDWLGNTVTYTYGDSWTPSSVTKISYPSSTGLTANYTFDNDGDPLTLSAGSNISDTWTYSHDDQVATSEINGSTSGTVAYNPNSQITAATNLASSTSNDTYTVAANGEILKDVPTTGTTYSYGYNAGGELCTVTAGASATACGSNPSTGTKYTFTSNGQRASATPYTSGTAGSSTYYAWNPYGELCNTATASTACGTTPTTGTNYTNNGDGLRIATTVTTSTTWSTTDSAWDYVSGGTIPLNINDESTTSSAPTALTNASYLYGDLLFGGTAPVEQITTTPSGSTADFLVANQTGVQGVFGSTGTLLQLNVYSVYGGQSIKSGSKVTPFGFEGSYTDATGLIYLVNRYYDPTTDQFLSIDPDVATTDQPYVFTNDDPLNAIDPLGLLACSGQGGKASCVKQIPTIKVSIKIKAQGNPDFREASYSNEPYSVSAKVSVTYTSDEGTVTETNVVFHYTSIKSAEAISDEGEVIVPGGSGQIYVSPAQYASAAEAQEALSLPNSPDGYYQIPLSRVPGLSEFTPVEPDFGFGGGGFEATTPNSIDVEGIPFTPFLG
jgi:RHS repeat-associated protein